MKSHLLIRILLILVYIQYVDALSHKILENHIVIEIQYVVIPFIELNYLLT